MDELRSVPSSSSPSFCSDSASSSSSSPTLVHSVCFSGLPFPTHPPSSPQSSFLSRFARLHSLAMFALLIVLQTTFPASLPLCTPFVLLQRDCMLAVTEAWSWSRHHGFFSAGVGMSHCVIFSIKTKNAVSVCQQSFPFSDYSVCGHTFQHFP